MNQGLNEGQNALNDLNDDKAIVQGYLDRLAYKGPRDKEPIMVSIIRGQLSSLESKVQQVTAQIEDVKAALEILKDYDYRVDAPPPSQERGYSTYRMAHIDDMIGRGFVMPIEDSPDNPLNPIVVDHARNAANGIPNPNSKCVHAWRKRSSKGAEQEIYRCTKCESFGKLRDDPVKRDRRPSF